jgi:hypothetical protein
MAHTSSYPEPNASHVGDGGGPFYTNQQGQRHAGPEDIEMLREISTGQHAAAGPQQVLSRVDQKFAASPYTAAQMTFPAAPPPIDSQRETPDGSNKKKSKVSRACDECRRKKVRYTRCWRPKKEMGRGMVEHALDSLRCDIVGEWRPLQMLQLRPYRARMRIYQAAIEERT